MQLATSYARRAQVETAFYGYKRTFGATLLARKLKNRGTIALCTIEYNVVLKATS